MFKLDIAHKLSKEAAKKCIERLAHRLKNDLGNGSWEWTKEFVLTGTATGIKRGTVTITERVIRLEIEPTFWMPATLLKEKILSVIDVWFPAPGAPQA